MRFLVEQTLIEGVKEVIQRYPKINEEDAIQIIKADPTSNVDRDIAGKYSKWLLNLYNSKNLKLEDLYKATEYLTVFDKKKNKFEIKDIMQYKSLPDLAEAVEKVNDIGNTAQDNKREAHKAHKDIDNHATLMWSDGSWEMWTPKDYQGECALGRNTHWCTASTTDDYYYNNYLNEYGGKYIIFINKSNEDEKYQLHFESGQFMDRLDREVDIKKFFDAYPNLKQALLKKEIIPNSIHYLDIDLNALEVSKDSDIVFTKSDVRDMISAKRYVSYGRGGRDDITGEDIVNMLANPWDYFAVGDDLSENDIMYNLESNRYYIHQDIWDMLYTLGIKDGGDFKALTNGWFEGNDVYDEIRSACASAYRDAVDVGSQDEFYDDVKTELELNVNDTLKEHPNYKLTDVNGESLLDGFTITVEPSEGEDLTDTGLFARFVRQFHNMPYEEENDEFDNPFIDENAIKAEIADDIMSEFRVSEPHYGWNGFNEDVFNAQLAEGLYEITKENKQ